MHVIFWWHNLCLYIFSSSRTVAHTQAVRLLSKYCRLAQSKSEESSSGCSKISAEPFIESWYYLFFSPVYILSYFIHMHISLNLLSFYWYTDEKEIYRCTGIIIEWDEVSKSATLVTSSQILCNEESQDNSIYYPNTKVNLWTTLLLGRILLYYSVNLLSILLLSLGFAS